MSKIHAHFVEHSWRHTLLFHLSPVSVGRQSVYCCCFANAKQLFWFLSALPSLFFVSSYFTCFYFLVIIFPSYYSLISSVIPFYFLLLLLIHVLSLLSFYFTFLFPFPFSYFVSSPSYTVTYSCCCLYYISFASLLVLLFSSLLCSSLVHPYRTMWLSSYRPALCFPGSSFRRPTILIEFVPFFSLPKKILLTISYNLNFRKLSTTLCSVGLTYAIQMDR
jgi:hypothetical protein